jgi:thiol-disulfide isomerase/thioredoxin
MVIGLSIARAADPAPATPADPKADAAWQAFKAVPDSFPKDMPVEERSAFLQKNWKLAYPLARRFYEDFSADPRHWEAGYRYVSIVLNTGVAPGEEKHAQDVAHEILAARDAPDKTVPWVEFTLIRYLLTPEKNPDVLKDEGFAAAGRELEAYAKRYPDGPNLFFADHMYADLLMKRDPAAAKAWLKGLLGSSSARVADTAKGMLAEIDAKERPLDLAFTAVDGRQVDTARLRGKIVLLDFWATWCVPCKQEMPNVIADYGKYHDKGLEVIGISLDRQADRQKLIDYCSEHGMPWPEYFDGKLWDNDVARKYAIGSIPGTFLLGEDGRIAAKDVHGAELEAAIRKLLKLDGNQNPL